MIRRVVTSLIFVSVGTAGCAKDRAAQSIGAVCMRAKKVVDRAHAERVQVVTDLKALGADAKPEVRLRLAGRCAATTHLDLAAQDIYTIVLDAQLVTTNRWEPLSVAVQRVIGTPGAGDCETIANGDDDAFSRVRTWAQAMKDAHDAAYAACRKL